MRLDIGSDLLFTRFSRDVFDTEIISVQKSSGIPVASPFWFSRPRSCPVVNFSTSAQATIGSLWFISSCTCGKWQRRTRSSIRRLPVVFFVERTDAISPHTLAMAIVIGVLPLPLPSLTMEITEPPLPLSTANFIRQAAKLATSMNRCSSIPKPPSLLAAAVHIASDPLRDGFMISISGDSLSVPMALVTRPSEWTKLLPIRKDLSPSFQPNWLYLVFSVAPKRSISTALPT